MGNLWAIGEIKTLCLLMDIVGAQSTWTINIVFVLIAQPPFQVMSIDSQRYLRKDLPPNRKPKTLKERNEEDESRGRPACHLEGPKLEGMEMSDSMADLWGHEHAINKTIINLMTGQHNQSADEPPATSTSIETAFPSQSNFSGLNVRMEQFVFQNCQKTWE